MAKLYGIWMTRKEMPPCWLSTYDGVIFYTQHLSKARAQLLTVMSGRELPIRDGDNHVVTELEIKEIGEDGRPVDETN